MSGKVLKPSLVYPYLHHWMFFFQQDANRTTFTKQNIVRNLVIELLQLTSSDILKRLGNRQKE